MVSGRQRKGPMATVCAQGQGPVEYLLASGRMETSAAACSRGLVVTSMLELGGKACDMELAERLVLNNCYFFTIKKEKYLYTCIYS